MRRLLPRWIPSLLLLGALVFPATGSRAGDEPASGWKARLARAHDLEEKGALEDAERIFRSLAEDAEREGRWRDARALLIELEALLELRHDVIGIRDAEREILAIECRKGDQRAAAFTRVNLGYLEGALGNRTRGIDLLEAALVWAELHKDEEVGAAAHARLAWACLEAGDCAEAWRHAEEAATFYRKEGDGLSLAEVLNAEAGIQRDLGDFEGSLATYGEAWSRLPAEEPLANDILANEGVVLYESGHVDSGTEKLRQALAVYERVGDAARAARVRFHLGAALLVAGRPRVALPLLRGVEYSASAPVWDTTRATLHAGQAYFDLGRLHAAKKRFVRAVEEGRALGSLSIPASAEAGLARVASRQGDAERALEHAQRGIDLEEKALQDLAPLERSRGRSKEERAEVFEAGLEAALSTGRPEAVYEMIELGRATALEDSRFQAVETCASPETLETLTRRREEVAAARIRYDEAARGGLREDLARAGRALEKALLDYGSALDRAQAANGARDGRSRVAPLAEVQAALLPREALVLYAFEGPEAFALVVAHDDPRLVHLGPASELLALLEDASGAPAAAERISALRARLVDPLGLPEEVDRVLVSPDGTLCRTPLALLLPEREAAFVPSASVLVRLRASARRRGEGVLAFGNPSYARTVEGILLRVYTGGASLVPLVASGDEVRSITTAGDERRLGPAATEEAFRTLAVSRSRWSAVHLAGHGFSYEQEPGRSCVALTPSEPDDGFLSVRELLGMSVPSDLVTLSACHSGRGPILPGEGLVGLPQAFLHAGASRIVASEWKVDDDATAALMIELYRGWREGLDVTTALVRAQRKVRAVRKWESPEFWAAWVVWGRPD